MDTTSYKQFENWLEKYKDAWENRNPGAVDDLFANDAEYCETPFIGKMSGIDAIRRYWEEGARDSQMNIKFSFDIITVKGNRGFAKWYAEFDRVGNRVHVQLNGILEAVFDENEKVKIFNEWWHRKETRP